MFEFTIAFKYLFYKRRRISSSLISLLSIFIISIVVWLILVFLSVTNGIERNWLNKLTSLNAPIKITPTDKYYSSYYYLSDSKSSISNYSYKNLSEKLISEKSDPYDPNVDMELSYSFPKPHMENGKLLDPVKKLNSILLDQKNKNSILSFQDFELSAALMRLNLSRENKDLFSGFKNEHLSFLTQMSYLVSLTEDNPNFKSLLLKPSKNDVNQLISQLDKTTLNLQKDIPSYPVNVDESTFNKKVNNFFKNISFNKVLLEKGYLINLSFFKETSIPVSACGSFSNDRLSSLIVLDKNSNKFISDYKDFEKGFITKINQNYFFEFNNKKIKIPDYIPIHLGENKILEANLNLDTLKTAKSLNDIKLNLINSPNNFLSGTIPLADIKIENHSIAYNCFDTPFYHLKNDKVKLPSIDDKTGILLPKNYQTSGVLIGDSGYLSYLSMTLNSSQELRIPIHVAGFYDPGVLPIGNKCLIVPPDITKTINSSSSNLLTNKLDSNGFYVWIKDLKSAEDIKTTLNKELQNQHISDYFEISTYKDFDFSKDLMQQFQSDKTLFTLIAIIILIAACSNIISMLVLLVNDKKKEIAILRSMGASPKSIALIFGFSGLFLGIVSSLIGVIAAIFTLKNFDMIIRVLSFIQGHSFFNSAFFGSKIPTDMSLYALLFVLVLTPIISLLAGLIPAIKASKINASENLRS